MNGLRSIARIERGLDAPLGAGVIERLRMQPCDRDIADGGGLAVGVAFRQRQRRIGAREQGAPFAEVEMGAGFEHVEN